MVGKSAGGAKCTFNVTGRATLSGDSADNHKFVKTCLCSSRDGHADNKLVSQLWKDSRDLEWQGKGMREWP